MTNAYCQRKLFLFAVILTLILLPSISPAQSVSSFSSEYKAYSQNYPWEKAYLHTDKPHYFLNDTIWIKAYALIENGGEIAKNSPSVPLYVDLIHHESGRQVEHIIVRLTEGKGQADIIIPRDVEAGIYTLRAYSNWMRNFGQEAFFNQNIWIGGLGDGPALENLETSNLNLTFFPEGGEMVTGLPSRIAFKGTDGAGKGTDLTGFLLNVANDTLANFSSEHQGMGSFRFTPQIGEKYKVIAKSTYSEWISYPFPEARSQGYILGVENNPDDDEIKFNIHQGGIASKSPLHLIGLYKGRVVVDRSIGVDEREFFLTKDDFYPGLVQFTVMDEEGNPMAERLVYFHPYAKGTAEFRTDKDEYKTQESVRVDIIVTDEFGSPVEGEFSLAVTDAQQVLQEGRLDIISYLELTSELKGEIEQPAYYFNPENQEAEKHLDNLLLTQGWRKFTWEKLTSSVSEPEFSFEESLSISGQVTRPNNKRVKEAELLTMVINTGREMPQVIEGATDELGKFVFLGLDFMDSVGVFIQTYTEREKRSGEIKQLKLNEVELKAYESPKFSQTNLISPPIYKRFEDFEDYLVEVKESRDYAALFRLNQEIELGEVTVKGKRSEQIPDNRTLFYRDDPDYRMEVTPDFYYYSNVFHLLRGRAPGVTVTGDVFSFITPPNILIRGGAATGPASGRDVGANIFIDGHPANKLTAMSLMIIDIDRIDVIKGAAKLAIFGSAGVGGVVNILTKTANPNRNSIIEHKPHIANATLKTKGYAPVRQFYVPNKDNLTPKTSFDYRSTIYWEPVILTDTYGKAYVEFPLTEGKTSIEMDLQGISKDGEPIRGSYRFDVR